MGAASEPAARPQAPLRGLHAQVLRGGPGAGVQQPACPARGRARLHRQPEERRLDRAARPLRRRRDLGRHAGAAGAEAPAARRRGRADRRRRGLQDRPPQPLADRLRQAGRGVRAPQRDLRQRHPAVQHHDLDGQADAQHPAQLRPVRARGHRRAHPRQVRGLAQEGHVDGRLAAARLRGREPPAGGGRARGGARAPDLRPLRQDRLGAHRRPRAERRGRGDEAAPVRRRPARRQAVDQGRGLQGARQPGLPRRGGAQGRRVPRRARRDHRPARPGTRRTP